MSSPINPLLEALQAYNSSPDLKNVTRLNFEAGKFAAIADPAEFDLMTGLMLDVGNSILRRLGENGVPIVLQIRLVELGLKVQAAVRFEGKDPSFEDHWRNVIAASRRIAASGVLNS